MNTPNMCIKCKGGRNLCGRDHCPKLKEVDVKSKIDKELSNDFFGPSNSIFVGRSGYPNVNVGPVGSLKGSGGEKPSQLFGKGYDDIIESRSFLIRSKMRHSVKDISDFIGKNQLLAMSKKNPDVEMSFEDRPSYKLSFSSRTQPVGPSASLNNLDIVDNPSIPRKVDYVINDELRAEDQLKKLIGNHDVYYLTNVFSSGAFGKEDRKKMVPTRWSITAVDDILAKDMMGNIKDYPLVNDYLVYESDYLDNKFVILLIPGKWEYENFEAWSPGSFWSSQLKETQVVREHESYDGRTTYADKERGGYYAARFAVCEALDMMKRQARVIVFREVSESYTVPVGVWQVRENVRNAFESTPRSFDDLSNALDYIGTQLKISMSTYKQRSKVLGQKRIYDFFSSKKAE